MNYPQRVDFHSNDLSVVRAGGPDFEKHFGRLRIDLPRVIKFILEHGECNGKRNGDQALGHQKWRIQIGCCGQGGVVNGVNAPKSTYSLGIFDEIDDPSERQSIKKIFADVLDCIQDCEDFVELKKLDKVLPFNDKKRLERFGAQLREAIGATRSRREDLNVQLKRRSQGERCGSHVDDLNCTWNGYTKMATLCLTMVDALGEMWSVKFITNSRAKTGNFLERLYKLKPILTRIKSQIEALDDDYQVHTFRNC
jgi:hypothetical protein